MAPAETNCQSVTGGPDQVYAPSKHDVLSTATVVESDENGGVVTRESENESKLSYYNISDHNVTWQKYAMENQSICDGHKFYFIIT